MAKDWLYAFSTASCVATVRATAFLVCGGLVVVLIVPYVLGGAPLPAQPRSGPKARS